MYYSFFSQSLSEFLLEWMNVIQRMCECLSYCSLNIITLSCRRASCTVQPSREQNSWRYLNFFLRQKTWFCRARWSARSLITSRFRWWISIMLTREVAVEVPAISLRSLQYSRAMTSLVAVHFVRDDRRKMVIFQWDSSSGSWVHQYRGPHLPRIARAQPMMGKIKVH